MAPDVVEIAKAAKAAFEASQLISSDERVSALRAIKLQMGAHRDEIMQANILDVQAAQKEVDAGAMTDSLLKRLDLGKPGKWEAMLQGIEDVASLPDPTGKVSYASELDTSLDLYRVSCPIGVLLIIFEARPEVVVNIASLAIKSGNAAILKGGKESNHTTACLSKVMSAVLSQTKLPSAYIQTIETRAEVSSLLKLDEYIDLVIPRGSNALVRNIQNNTRIPVMGHADGLCLAFVDESADVEKAVRIIVDSKVDYPAACNALETLIIHESLLTTSTIWPEIAKALLQQNVTLLCDPSTLQALQPLLNNTANDNNYSNLVKPSTEEAYNTEHLSLTLSVLALPNIHDAIKWINSHGSHHTDIIITESQTSSTLFCRGVDSAGTFVNASTRFSDGFRYGFGTEVGISTGRIHARGPVGLEGLMTYKYILRGRGDKGHIVAEYSGGTDKKTFKHTPIPNVHLQDPFH